jgi:hypothetical protein
MLTRWQACIPADHGNISGGFLNWQRFLFQTKKFTYMPGLFTNRHAREGRRPQPQYSNFTACGRLLLPIPTCVANTNDRLFWDLSYVLCRYSGRFLRSMAWISLLVGFHSRRLPTQMLGERDQGSKVRGRDNAWKALGLY